MMRYAFRHAQSIVTGIDSDQSTPSRRRTSRSLIALLVDALYHSHQVQAERTLCRYRHLIDQAQGMILHELNSRSKKREHSRE